METRRYKFRPKGAGYEVWVTKQYPSQREVQAKRDRKDRRAIEGMLSVSGMLLRAILKSGKKPKITRQIKIIPQCKITCYDLAHNIAYMKKFSEDYSAQKRKVSWTNQQQDAIDTRNRSIIVSAAAGSGKTAVLVERLFQILADPSPDTRVGADEIIVVTFTKDAASQMKQRLSRKISETIEEMNRSGKQHESAYEWLIQQKSTLSNAKISTIHSFCFDFIRENADACGVSQQFSIAEPAKEYVFKKKALEFVLTEWSQNRKSDMKLLFNYFCTREDSEIEKYIEMTAEYLNSQAFPSYWIKKAKAFCCEENTIFIDAVRKCIVKEIESCIQLAEQGRTFAVNALDADDPDDRKFEICLDKDIAELRDFQQFVQNADKNALIESASKYEMNFPRFPSSKSKVLDIESKEIFKTIREMYKEKYKNIKESLLTPLKFLEEDEQIQKQVIPLLLELTEEYLKALFEEKKLHNVLSFDDAEHLVLSVLGNMDDDGILHRSELAKVFSEKYQLIMIDEYQDSNDKQDCLFKLLSNECEISEDGKLHYGTNVFLVGDIKQSIYRFRQANPDNFKRAVESSMPLENCQGQEMASIYLNQNFRSSELILNFINELFQNIMSVECGELVYDENQQLNFGAKPYQNLAEEYQGVQILLPKSNNDFPVEDLQVECAVDTIEKMIASQFPVLEADGTIRPCSYKDFCLLFRTLNNAKNLVEILQARGIPFSCEDDEGFLNLPEIKLVLNLLKVIDNPMTDISMAGVLLSPIYGFTPEDLAMLKIYGKHKRIYLQMQNISSQEQASLSQKCNIFLTQLQQMRTLADTLPLEQFIYEVYEMTDLMALQSLYGQQADERREHLNIFTQFAQNYREHADLNAQSSLSGWLHYLNYMKESGEKISADFTNQKSDYISIKTIHKSKGLEYPFIFLMHSEKKFSSKPKQDDLLPAESGMLGLQMIDRKRCLKFTTNSYRYLLYQKNKEEKSEEMRLLYVALTRAKQKLFLVMNEIYTGCSPKTHICNKEKILENNSSILETLVPELDSMQEWILAYLLSSDEADYLISAMDLKKDTNSELAEYRVWKMHQPEMHKEAQQQEISISDENLLEKVKKQIGWEYDSYLTEIPAKRTVTSLAHPENSSTEQTEQPEFMLEDEEGRIRRLKGAARGTAIHKMMQFMNFKSASENLEQELKRMENAHVLEKIEAESIRHEKIQAFFTSTLYQRIAKSDAVLKEKQLFVQIGKLNLPESSVLLQEYLNTDGIMIGTVDLLFHEPDGWVIVDYKTDRGKTSGQLIEKYALQLGLYQKAMELLLEEPVKQAYLYSFELDEAIEVNLSQIKYT